MARKIKIVIIEEHNRDKGKCFQIKEMSAWDVEKWARDALILLAKSGADIGNVNADEGFAGIMRAGMRPEALMQLKGEDLDPLMDRMMECVSYISDPKHTEFVQPLRYEDVEELSTIVLLRTEVMKLHQSFFSPGEKPTTSVSSTTQDSTDQPSQLTRTLPPRSGPSSRVGMRQ